VLVTVAEAGDNLERWTCLAGIYLVELVFEERAELVEQGVAAAAAVGKKVVLGPEAAVGSKGCLYCLIGSAFLYCLGRYCAMIRCSYLAGGSCYCIEVDRDKAADVTVAD
jgi:hypothetical protein